MEGKEVQIRRQGKLIVLEPIEKGDGWDWLRNFPPFPDDFVAAVNEKVPMPPDNPEIDRFFAE